MGTALCKTSVGNARPCAFALDGVWQYPLDYLGVPDQPAPLAVAADWPIDEGARNCATTKMPWQPKAR